MKRISLVIAIILIAQMSFAQHYIGVGGSLSSPFQLDKSDATKPLVGWGEGITLQYQYRYEHFLLSIGAAMSCEHPRVSVADEDFVARMRDTRPSEEYPELGFEFDYIGSLIRRQDLSSTVWFHTPVMIGFETFPFYMMAGAEYSLFLASWTQQNAMMAAGADYLGRYYDDYIDDMFTHGYHNYEPVSSKGRMKYKNDIRLLVELGGTIPVGVTDKGLDKLLRIGLFGEIGLMNTMNNTMNPTKTEWDVSEYMNVSMNHIYSAADGNTGSLRNVVAGVKITYLFPAGGQNKRYRSYRNSKKYKCRCVNYSYYLL